MYSQFVAIVKLVPKPCIFEVSAAASTVPCPIIPRLRQSDDSGSELNDVARYTQLAK
jgi:hypothetical protein